MEQRKFDYKFKENMTQAEVDAVLEQHIAFLKVNEITAENTKLKDELKPYQDESFNKELKAELPSNFKGSLDDFKLISGITNEDDKATRAEKIKKGLEGRDYFLDTSGSNELPPEKNNGVELPVETEESDFLADYPNI